MAAINILIEDSNNLKLSGRGRRELMILFKFGVDKMIYDLTTANDGKMSLFSNHFVLIAFDAA
jgi:hypothetical protein